MKALTLLGAALAYSVVSSASLVPPRAVDSVNAFLGRYQYGNPEYAQKLTSYSQTLTGSADQNLYKKTIHIRDNYPTWTWLDNVSKVSKVAEYLEVIQKTGRQDLIAMFVIYNLPCRECGTTKPHGDLSLDEAGEQGYMEFIDSIKAAVDNFPNTPVAFIIEPEAITNLVVYKDAENCKAADPVYRRLIAYAIQSLAGMNVHLYLDGGHSGLLGWDGKIDAAAGIAADIYQAAGSPVNLHGLSVNVGRNDLWSFRDCPAPSGDNGVNKNCDSKRFINSLSPLLAQLGWANARFIIDESRAGVPPPTSFNQTHTCNIRGTGFGIQPGTGTGDPLADAYVWVKPPGESDGLSVDDGRLSYNPDCNDPGSYTPSPEYGEFFGDFFKGLVENAHPAITAS